MNRETLKAAVKAAKAFIAAAEDIEQDGDNRWLIVGTRASGAARRASMDLTRALSDLRRPN